MSGSTTTPTLQISLERTRFMFNIFSNPQSTSFTGHRFLFRYIRMSASIIQFYMTLRNGVKVYHWNTKSYPRHKATDEFVDNIDKLTDKFVEVYMGKYGRPNITKTTNTIQVRNMADKSAMKFIKDCIAHLTGPFTKSLKVTDTDLLNIRDEILGELNQLLYLFTLG
jgi:DNA-binding ferritin-like protein